MENELVSCQEIATGNDSAFLNIRVLEREKGWPGPGPASASSRLHVSQ
jgi:hypothetical protein